MQLRHPRLAVAVAVGVVGLFTFGAVSSAGAVTFPMKAFLQTGQSTTMFNVQGASFRARCSNDQNPNVPENFLIARIVGTASNGLAKVAGTNEFNDSFINDADDLDTNETLDLVTDNFSSAWQDHEVTAQANYMGSGGNPVVNANYSTEQSGSQPTETVGADCLVFGTAQSFG